MFEDSVRLGQHGTQHKFLQTQKSYREGGAGCGQTLGTRKIKKMGKLREQAIFNFYSQLTAINVDSITFFCFLILWHKKYIVTKHLP